MALISKCCPSPPTSRPGRDWHCSNSHRTNSVRDVIGRVESVSTEGNTLVAALVLTSAEDAAGIGQRIADQSVTGVSIGYRVAGWAETTGPTGRVKHATAWSLTEVTLTSNPADPAAQIRQQEESPMPDPIETITPEAEEATRRSDIRTLVRSAGLGAEVADQLIDAGADMTRAKAEVFDHMQTRRSTTPIIRSHQPQNDDPATILRRQTDALVFRMAGGELPEASREFLGHSALDFARDAIARTGQTAKGLSTDETFARAAHTTSDFPALLENSISKVALANFRVAESPLKTISRQRNMRDFKPGSSVRLGELGRLEPLTEAGEIQATSRAEASESFRLSTFARRIDVTRELLVNDDLGMLGDMSAAFGQSAADTEAAEMVTTLTSNPVMKDGTAVFHASRGNIAAVGTSLGSAGDVGALDDARKAMRGYVELDGRTLVSASPRYLLVGPAGEAAAERFLASIYPATVGDAQSGMARLSLLVEPRLGDSEAWWVFSDPARLAGMVFGYLASAPGPQVQRQDSWNTLGVSYRCWLDFGCAWTEPRAAYLNGGDA